MEAIFSSNNIDGAVRDMLLMDYLEEVVGVIIGKNYIPCDFIAFINSCLRSPSIDSKRIL
jgi:hypothetical protein